ncbi:MAG TPA: dTDP-4-dehydrorhamnose reductase [Lachnospiraceae bacterium]|nr:dTDP-4-dehydrorhamnose reductase [Lachnospiraceae bacterium]
MKVLVTGVAGQLGHDVMNELSARGYEGTGTDLAPEYAGIQDGSAVTVMPYVSLDITDRQAVRSAVKDLAPDVIVHCAAWTAVDLAEDADKVQKVKAVNVDGTRNIAEAAASVGSKIVYLSTDYVFDGTGTRPWKPDDQNYAPLNVYGQTKLDGEKAVASATDRYFIVRIAWVFGRNGKNFIRTMLNVGKNHDELRVVDDQIGTPTYTLDLSSLLVDMIETEKYGYYHATNSELSGEEGGATAEGTRTGYISWYDFAKEIFRQAALLGHEEYDEAHLKLIPVSTKEYGVSKAKRPFNSRLDKSKLTENGFSLLPDWQDALARFLREIEI